MRTKNPETMNQIKEFVDKYYFENNKSPSVRKIANGIGIVGSTAFRYLQEMNEKGMLVYDGKSVTTEKIGKFNTKLYVFLLLEALQAESHSWQMKI